ALLGAVAVSAACNLVREPVEAPSLPISKTSGANNVIAAFGNPSNATEDPTNIDNYLIVGEGSVISYNNSRGTANWISWRTTKADLGEKLERPDFKPDARLPEGYRRISYSDLSGSGYDRGHLVPSADRFADSRAN